MGSTCRSFTEEYKAQAVEFVIDQDRPVAEVARNMGCHEMTLGRCVKKAQEASQRPYALLDESERAELVRLRGAIKESKSENAHLLMALGISAGWRVQDDHTCEELCGPRR